MKDWKWYQSSDLEEGAGREFLPNNPIPPAWREALKGNKRVDETPNLSLPQNAQRNKSLHLLYTKAGIKSVFSFFFLQEREQRLWRDLLKAAADKETTRISKEGAGNKQ